MTSHPSLSSDRMTPDFPLSGMSKWSADQVDMKSVPRQLVRMEYVPRKCGSSCQETVAFMVLDDRRTSGLSTEHVLRGSYKITDMRQAGNSTAN